nr:uncharacterized protein LOC128688858 isoform X1 [Cherax quadricarinatus]
MAEEGSVVYRAQENRSHWMSTYSFLNENSFTLLRSDNQKLLQGPRRVVRLCMCAVLLPTILITIPLYVRLVLYPPGHYPMMPTDQRLLSRHVSGVWCQAQTTRMNGSYNAYVSPRVPSTSVNRSTHCMLHSTLLQDDIKEYWGFHLLKGSKVTISACASTVGAQLMILRGVENLRRCAWIGEEDSEEEVVIQDVEDPAGDSDPELHSSLNDQQLVGVSEDQSLGNQDGEHYPGLTEVLNELQRAAGGALDTELQTNETDTPIFIDQSEERRKNLRKLLRQAVKMSKSKKEILQILHLVGRDGKRQLPKRIKYILGIKSEEVLPFSLTETSGALGSEERIPNKTGEAETLTKRNIRSVKENIEDYDGAFEIFDEGEDIATSKHSRNMMKRKPTKPTDSVEKMVGGQIFFPEGLKFERGMFNQTTKLDGSNEEEVSSFSSSEEALASCEGVIMTLPLVAYRSCNYRWIETNKVVYDIPVTGTYYFVFSSDNEISTNQLFFNLTIDRVVYDTSDSRQVCTNTTNCLIPLSFWSNEQTLVEVPEENTWDHSYMLDTKCDPRVPVYLTFLILAPLMILFCAFN